VTEAHAGLGRLDRAGQIRRADALRRRGRPSSKGAGLGLHGRSGERSRRARNLAGMRGAHPSWPCAAHDTAVPPAPHGQRSPRRARRRVSSARALSLGDVAVWSAPVMRARSVIRDVFVPSRFLSRDQSVRERTAEHLAAAAVRRKRAGTSQIVVDPAGWRPSLESGFWSSGTSCPATTTRHPSTSFDPEGNAAPTGDESLPFVSPLQETVI